MLIGLDTVSIGEPSAKLADPSSGLPRRSGVGNFSDRDWGEIGDRYHFCWTLVSSLAELGIDRDLAVARGPDRSKVSSGSSALGPEDGVRTAPWLIMSWIVLALCADEGR